MFFGLCCVWQPLCTDQNKKAWFVHYQRWLLMWEFFFFMCQNNYHRQFICQTLCCPQSLLETHDSVASKNYETPPPSPCSFMDAALNNQPVPPDAVRMVGIRKVSGEHLVSLLANWCDLCFGKSSMCIQFSLQPCLERNKSDFWRFLGQNSD